MSFSANPGSMTSEPSVMQPKVACASTSRAAEALERAPEGTPKGADSCRSTGLTFHATRMDACQRGAWAEKLSQGTSVRGESELWSPYYQGLEFQVLERSLVNGLPNYAIVHSCRAAGS